MATNFIKSSLSDWTNANPQKVLEVVILSGMGTKDYFDIETGVKYKTNIPDITDVTIDISTGAIAGYRTGSGGTTLNELTLENKTLNFFETYTKEQLTKTILGALETKGTDPNEMPLEQIILALKGKQLFKQNEYYLWQDTGALVPNGGILKQLSDASTYKSAGFADVSFQTITDTSILSYVALAVKSLETNLPQYIGESMIMALSPANFSAYSRAVYNLNGTVTTQTVGADGTPVTELFVPGTSIKAVSMIGLNGSNELVITHPSNIIEVVDLVDETDEVSLIWNPFARWFELAGQYKLGVKVAHPELVVKTI